MCLRSLPRGPWHRLRPHRPGSPCGSLQLVTAWPHSVAARVCVYARPPLGDMAASTSASVTMHPLTLQFSNDLLEQRICSERCATANKCLMLFATCMLIFSLFSPHGYTYEQTSLCFLALLCICLASRHGHAAFSWVWMFSWAVNVCVWWWLLWTGKIKRLGPEDAPAVSSCCAIYVQAALYQRVLHFNPWHRASVFCCVLPIIIRSPNWMCHLLGALCGGEAMGYVLEHMLREAFLRRVQSLEAVYLRTAEMQEALSQAQAHSMNLETARREQLIAERRSAILSEVSRERAAPVGATQGVTRRPSRSQAGANTNRRRPLESIADDVSEYSWGENRVEELLPPGS